MDPSMGTKDKFEDDWCKDFAEKCARELAALEEYGKDDPQAAFHFLRLCFAPKIDHLLRTVAPDNVRAAAAKHDEHIWETFKKIHGIRSADEQTRIQSGLSGKDGGCA